MHTREWYLGMIVLNTVTTIISAVGTVNHLKHNDSTWQACMALGVFSSSLALIYIGVLLRKKS